ncbi:MAG: HNH endonuclease [Cetobacterium sp.]
MPTAASRYCASTGCPNLSASRYCEQHAGKRERLYDAHRGTSAQRGYDTTWYGWLALYRAGSGLDLSTSDGIDQLLSRNCCAQCAAKGQRVKNGLEFDHITPLSKGGARLDAANVQPLCGPCHRRKTARERLGDGA